MKTSQAVHTVCDMRWDPWDEVGERGVDVYECPCPAEGLYFPAENVIVVRRGLTGAQRRSVLAEELAHHTLGHRPNRDDVETARMELRARRWASRRLTSLDDLAEAIAAEDNWADIADRLDIDERMLRQRLDDLDDRDRRSLRQKLGRRELEL